MRTPLCEMLGIEHPVIQAAIGGAAGPELAAVVSNAGALGTLALTGCGGEGARRRIGETRNRTGRSFVTNVVLAYEVEAEIEAMLEQQPKLVSFFWGDPAPYVDRVHDTGAKLLMTVGSVEEAAPGRVLRTPTVAAWERAGRPASGTRPGEGEVVGRDADGSVVRRYDANTARREHEGDIDAFSLWAGQGVGLVTREQPAAEIVEEIVADACLVLRAGAELTGHRP